MYPRTRAGYATVLIFTTIASTFGQERPVELKGLDQYVGHWISDVAISPAVWNPAGRKLRTKSQGKLVLDSSFLCGIEVSHEIGSPKTISKSLSLRTYDSLSKKYVLWRFHSTGGMAKWTGSWNETMNSLTAVLSEPPSGTTAKLTESFPNDNTNNGTVVFTDSDGRTLFDMTWTRTRQKPLAKNLLREAWSTIGTPIEPIPKEVKRLEPLIGTWHAKFAYHLPQHREQDGVVENQWVLDGRFILSRAKVGNTESISVIGYDTNQQAYRIVRAETAAPVRISESAGRWDEETKSLIWTTTHNSKSIATWKLAEQDSAEMQVGEKQQDGTVRLNLMITMKRRKSTIP